MSPNLNQSPIRHSTTHVLRKTKLLRLSTACVEVGYKVALDTPEPVSRQQLNVPRNFTPCLQTESKRAHTHTRARAHTHTHTRPKSKARVPVIAPAPQSTITEWVNRSTDGLTRSRSSPISLVYLSRWLPEQCVESGHSPSIHYVHITSMHRKITYERHIDFK